MVVVDSCVLILLSKAGRLSLLKYFGEVVVTRDVYKEVVGEAEGRPGASELRKACGDWIKVLCVEDAEVGVVGRLEGLEEADASLILLGRHRSGVLLTNDRVLIQVARTMNVECWWLTTFILKLVKENEIKKREAEEILFDLIKAGMRLKIEVYAAILKEVKRM